MIQDVLVLPSGREICSGAAESVAIESLSYTRQVNPADDWDPGCACAAQIQVKLLDETGSFSVAPGTQLLHYRRDGEGNRLLMGTFYTEKPTRPGKNTLTFTAYDAMVKAEVDMTDWLASLTGWPYTVQQLLKMVCGHCGIPLAADINLCNGQHPVLQFARSVTARQLIAWVAGANGAYAAITAAGELTLGHYTENSTPITAVNCAGVRLAEAPCAPIARVAIGQELGDVAAQWPENATGECYHITGNPLLAAFSQDTLTRCAANIYDKVAGFTYTPFQAEVFADSLECPWQPGQLVTVEGTACAVFSMELCGSIAKLKSTGSPSRDSAAARYSRDSVQLLQGQMTRVTEDISGVHTQVSRVTTQVENIRVGGRNRIRESQTLADESYYFSSGAATSDTATVTGNPVVITDVHPDAPGLDVRLPQELSGSTVRCCGKNLIPYPYYYKSTTSSGVTVTDNGDGTLKFNGTATAQFVYYCNTKTNPISLPQGTVVTLSGTPQGYGGKCFIQGTDETAYPTDGGTGYTFTASGGAYRFYIVVTAGTVLENVIVCPQLEVGSTATVFESYTCQTSTADAGGNVPDLTGVYPVTTLVTDTGPLTVTYRRISALAAVRTQPPEGQDPVLRFTVDTAPENFVMPDLMQPGQGYTFSCWGKGTNSILAAGQKFPLTDQWEKYSCTFTAQGTDLVLEFPATGTFDLYHPQLERGTLATDWSAAPEDLDAAMRTTRQQISSLQVEADKISAQVSLAESTAQADINRMESSVKKLTRQAELAVTADQVQIAVSTALEEGTKKVTTETGYTFDEKGLTISTNRSDVSNLLDHTGMKVSRGAEVLLQADAAGVTARDVTVHNYLVMGDHARFEDYGTARTACFWV